MSPCAYRTIPPRPKNKLNRICYRCGIEKPIQEFRCERRTVPTTSIVCQSCRPNVPKELAIRRLISQHQTKANLYGVVSTLTVAQWIEILSSSGGRCFYCSRRVGEDRLTVEHLVPFVRGGSNVATNVVAACWPCNMAKGEKLVDMAAVRKIVAAGVQPGRPRKAGK